jgi:hypothetical protein
MSALSRFEQFMEHMVEGSVARLFRSPIQPSEIAKRLERAMEGQQMISVRRIIVPNNYHVYLHPQDFQAFQPVRAEMEREMANYLAELAQERNFSMLEHPKVALAEDPAVARRSIQVVADTAGSSEPEPTTSQTMVIETGKAGTVRAKLLLGKRGTQQSIPLDSTLVSIGRGLNNDVILEDARVSRNHAQVRYRARRFWVTDLGSTNGTFVNGDSVSESALRDGDIISLGGLELTFKEG